VCSVWGEEFLSIYPAATVPGPHSNRALHARAGLSYRRATMMLWQCGRSARSPCPPILMLR